ncbi:hypothetical protein C5167_038472 [Papaver somniferum]|uniref:Uncharacterized protein n=1 Tax=Papaver somniferum TaxID=3469 RepID=A0A4Y7I9A5_PAPSO|nr:hypothetical protein C5167_038472 [Papaver somniferum]
MVSSKGIKDDDSAFSSIILGEPKPTSNILTWMSSETNLKSVKARKSQRVKERYLGCKKTSEN